MKTLLPFTLLIAGTGLMQAAIIQRISLDLSALHAGSTLSGTFTLPDSPMDGDAATVLLSFSNPSDYMPTSLIATISILTGTPDGLAVDFSPLSFTNLSGMVTPINTRDVDLTRFFFARCESFPCTATGLFEDRNPPVFQAEYTITPASIPEPGYALLVAMLLTAAVIGVRLGNGRSHAVKIFLRPTYRKAYR
jgi:hypothetical protein